jgi:hypothetical protein
VDHVSKQQFGAVATREGKWWIVEVEGVGTTQGRSAAEARAMAKDLVSAMLDVPLESVDVSVTFEVPGKLREEVKAARAATLQAAVAQEEAAAKSRKAVADLKAEGLSGADIAAVLDLSPQRVSQLAKRSPEDDQKRNESIRRSNQVASKARRGASSWGGVGQSGLSAFAD